VSAANIKIEIRTQGCKICGY